jgi:D-cysteine desulfhydrase
LLFAEAPGLRTLPFVPFTNLPTPVEQLTGWDGRVWLKRDDRVADRYGGNKVRRFELLFGRALDEGARTLVTVGGLASTQVTATILFGRSVGLDVTAVLFDQPKSDFMRESIGIDLRAGGRLVHGGSYLRTARRFLEEQRRAYRPFAILPGASSPLCNLGYVDAMLELALQVERGEMPRPDRIIVPCGSGGTVAGLTVGAAWLGWPTRIVGVRITDLIASNRLTVGMLASGTARLVARGGGASRERLSRGRFEIDHRFVGPGYGFSTPEAEAGARKMGDVLGVPGEVTYSGKAFAGLERQAREHPSETILFWCTLSSRGRTPDKLACPHEASDEIRRLYEPGQR